jgi:ParB family chromosome partitioning protein
LAQLVSGALSAGHARSLLALPSTHAQAAVARDVIARRLSVRDTETLVRARAQPAHDDVEQRAVEAELARALGTRVHLRHNKDGSGRIMIEYYSLDELDGLLTRLGARKSA